MRKPASRACVLWGEDRESSGCSVGAKGLPQSAEDREGLFSFSTLLLAAWLSLPSQSSANHLLKFSLCIFCSVTTFKKISISISWFFELLNSFMPKESEAVTLHPFITSQKTNNVLSLGKAGSPDQPGLHSWQSLPTISKSSLNLKFHEWVLKELLLFYLFRLWHNRPEWHLSDKRVYEMDTTS